MSAIKPLTHDHAQQMVDLHAAAFPKGQAWTRASFEDVLALPTTRALGDFEGATLASLLIVQFLDHEAEILTIATAPEFLRNGKARALLINLQDSLQPLGLQKWLLDVAADNLTAIAFYERLGFRQDGRRPGYYNRLEGPRIDAILMSKDLSGQAIM